MANRSAFKTAPLALALLATPADAIVGGAEDAGPLARSSVMVLSGNGGVCTGVVVARDVVLTAGHCAAGAEHRVHWRAEDGAPVLAAPAAKAVHPGYVADAVAARRRSIDLALIRLKDPLPARFEPAALSAQTLPAGSRLTVGGYGVARVGDGRSSGTFRTAALGVVEPYGPSAILVWARGAGQGTGMGACQGDSGGPMAPAGSPAVMAVATWAAGVTGQGCGGISQGVRLGPQRAWIDRTLAAWGRSATWE